jgi:hypothetical protein
MNPLDAQTLKRIRRAQANGRFVECIRWPRYGDTITGYMVHCTPDSILVEQLNWDTFRLNGLCLFTAGSLARIHVFDETEWPIRAARRFRLTKHVSIQWTKRSYSTLLRDLAASCELVEIEQERVDPGALFLCEVIAFTRAGVRVRSYERNLRDAKDTTLLFRNITKVTLHAGYSRAATVVLRDKSGKCHRQCHRQQHQDTLSAIP